jgi:lysophospholipase
MPILSITEITYSNATSNEYDGIYFPGINPKATQVFSLLNTLISKYECNPFEFGAWQGRASAFVPTQYLGTTMINGSAINNTCVVGFDQTGFAMGTSSSAWNLWLLNSLTNGIEGQFAKRDLGATEERHVIEKRQSAIELIPIFVSAFNETLNESLYAVYPNPFQGYNNSLIDVAKLELVDGSESGQTVPLFPVLQSARDVDFIIAWDASAETPYAWQNGTNIIDTYNAAIGAGLKFPKVPTAITFVDFKLNSLPTFFGCYEDDVPLVFIS